MPRASHGFQYNAISIKSVSTEAFRCPCNTHFRREQSWQIVNAQLPASTVCHHPPANTLRQLPSASTLRQPPSASTLRHPPSASTLRQLPHANTLRQLWARFRIRKQRNNRWIAIFQHQDNHYGLGRTAPADMKFMFGMPIGNSQWV